jgi:hypothetical protein
MIETLVGTTIHIIYMDGEPQYSGKEGVVNHVDSIGQLHGTWGGLAVNPTVDRFRVIANKGGK